MKPLFPIVMVIILVISGCANLSDVRHSEPTYSLVSTQPPKKLANCIVYKAQAASLDSWNRYWDPPKLTEIDGTYKILLTFTGGLFLTVSQLRGELTIAPLDNGHSKVEYRTPSLLGGKEQFWELVKQCASPTNTTPAP
ncbi:MAG: hypothetical protein WC600_17220 [Desulfobaccales bacterium]